MTAMRLRMTRQSKRRLEKLEKKHAQLAQSTQPNEGDAETTAATKPINATTTEKVGLSSPGVTSLMVAAELEKMDTRTRSLYRLLDSQHQGDPNPNLDPRHESKSVLTSMKVN